MSPRRERGPARLRRDAPNVWGLGGPVGAPMSPRRERGASRLRRDAPNVWGLGGPVGAPISPRRERGASRLRRDAPNVWGLGGPVGAPISPRRERGASRLRRDAPNVWGLGGPVGAPMSLVRYVTGESGLLAGRSVAVNHTAGDGLVQGADRLEHRAAGVGAAGGDDRPCGLDRGADLGADHAVADAPLLVLPHPLSRRFRVRQPTAPPAWTFKPRVAFCTKRRGIARGLRRDD